jgi:hypothetical protein
LGSTPAGASENPAGAPASELERVTEAFRARVHAARDRLSEAERALGDVAAGRPDHA